MTSCTLPRTLKAAPRTQGVRGLWSSSSLKFYSKYNRNFGANQNCNEFRKKDNTWKVVNKGAPSGQRFYGHDFFPDSKPPRFVFTLNTGGSHFLLIESLSTVVFEPRTSTGSRNFSSSTRITPFSLKILSCKC